MIAHLPSALRRRVVLGVVAALLAGSGALAGAAVGIHHSVWMQVRAERLAVTEPRATATYLGSADSGSGTGITFSLADDEHARLAGGRVVSLWRPEFPVSEVAPDLNEKVEVVVFPGQDRAVLAAELPDAEYAVWQRGVDWVTRVPRASLFFGLLLGIWVGAVRLALGFTPRALPSLLRGRDGVDAVVVDWARLAKPDEALVSVAVGDVTHQWTTRVGSDAPPRLGDTLRMVGRVRDGGWVLAWTDESRLLPTGPLHTPDAEVVRT
ncbi:hypothetical protein KV100_07800 [Mumia sp. zg.B21]|uniref:hypothetical protein n=1 Tax=Mumia sp. zg.B21 TaxID=2855447 RepID=UPI001C6EF4F0|nr:hypothetical protein [Mumia sp. zg.B21]MBW9209556.1 hypothetical protein [Mumia sp. zg.B21]